MNSKEWHRDRINELEGKRKDYSDSEKFLVQTVVGLSALFLAMLSIYFRDVKLYLSQIVIGTIAFFVALIILIFLTTYTSRMKNKYLRKLKRNYNQLLGREK